ncbi:MAG: tRNA glutamyl-Q(34) synthetase GluQRS [Pseudomonadales bacterium]|nr:tRNA glutamyl-Q(34) synthetase GluQRS [Pseudomonadales bacterium]
MPASSPLSQALYSGRFAPSPSGPLHFGSLLTAVASFLISKSHNGNWQLRIEDIDPPREQQGATEQIIQSLLAHGLRWDGEVVYQSRQSSHYQAALDQLFDRQKAYRCNCNRQRLKQLNNGYDRHCLKHQPSPQDAAAIRFLAPNQLPSFFDQLQGQQAAETSNSYHDFIIKRKDGLWAYQLAVVVDDIATGISDVVRGIDLISSTAKQLALYSELAAADQPLPNYLHLPIIVDAKGNKLSKQNHAPAIDNGLAYDNLIKVLQLLGQAIPPATADRDIPSLIAFAIERFDAHNIPHTQALRL